MEDGEIDSRLRENDKKRGLYYFFNGKDFFARGCFTMIFNFYFLESCPNYLLSSRFWLYISSCSRTFL